MTEKVKPKIEKVKRLEKKKNPLGELTNEEREAVTIVFHQFETGLREGTIFTKVVNHTKNNLIRHSLPITVFPHPLSLHNVCFVH